MKIKMKKVLFNDIVQRNPDKISHRKFITKREIRFGGTIIKKGEIVNSIDEPIESFVGKQVTLISYGGASLFTLYEEKEPNATA